MNVSEISGYENKIISFLKFTNYFQNFINGEIFMNNLEYYIRQEEENNERGMGDLLEGSQFYSDVNLTFHDIETGEIVINDLPGNINFRFNDDIKKPVFCVFALETKHFNIIEEDEEYYTAVMNFTNEDIERMIQDFGENLIVISRTNDFIQRFDNALNDQELQLIHNKVRYDDYTINSSERIESYHNGDSNIYFWKDNFFQSQNEYRFIIVNEEINEGKIIQLGDLSDIVKHYNARDFFSDNFVLKIRKNRN